MNPQARKQGGKVRKVMKEFGAGTLKSSSGQKVTNPKQAVAIALSEQRRAKGLKAGVNNPKTNKGKSDFKFAEGGEMKESKKMVKKEIAFMKKKGAPKSMIKHEEAEAKGYARGGGIESKGKTKGTAVKMARGGGIESRGKTRGKFV